MKPYRVILNPAAGHGNGARCKTSIQQLLAAQGLDYDLACTEHPGHAVEITRQAVQAGVEVIVSAGGDGTLNEVINGLMLSRGVGVSLPAVGILGVGRGNDFGGSLGIPANLEAACRLLAQGNRRWIDVGRVTGGLCPQGR